MSPPGAPTETAPGRAGRTGQRVARTGPGENARGPASVACVMTVPVAVIRTALAGRAPVQVPRGVADREAAVAAVFREGPMGAEVLLIRRATQPGDPWSGQMAFPGGRHDASDPDLLHTAIREAKEEVGLGLDPDTQLLGRLDDLPAVARGKPVGLVITPFVFVIEGQPLLTPCDREVDAILWTPVAPLVRGERDTTVAWEHGQARLRMPGFDVGGDVVWGLTHRMLVGLFGLLDVGPGPRYGSNR